jgi:hypothetical protein
MWIAAMGMVATDNAVLVVGCSGQSERLKMVKTKA